MAKKLLLVSHLDCLVHRYYITKQTHTEMAVRHNHNLELRNHLRSLGRITPQIQIWFMIRIHMEMIHSSYTKRLFFFLRVPIFTFLIFLFTTHVIISSVSSRNIQAFVLSVDRFSSPPCTPLPLKSLTN